MSHFTKVATKINDLVALKKALDQLGWKYTHNEQGVTVRGYRGQTVTAEMSIDMGKYDIGVVKTEEGTEGGVAVGWGAETTRDLKGKGAEKKKTPNSPYRGGVVAAGGGVNLTK